MHQDTIRLVSLNFRFLNRIAEVLLHLIVNACMSSGPDVDPVAAAKRRRTSARRFVLELGVENYP